MLLTARELTRRGHTLTIVCPPGSLIGTRCAAAGIPVRHLLIRQDYDLPAAWKLKQILAQEKAGIVHAHHPQAHAVALAAKFMGADLLLVVTRRVIFKIRTNPFSALKYRSGLVNRFIAVCRKTADELVKGGVKRSRLAVIPSAIETEKWKKAGEKRPVKLCRRPFRIGMVGHYAEFKGHRIFLSAAKIILAAFPDTVFVIAGRDSGKLAPFASGLGIASNVMLLGERDDIPDILADLDVFVMPSLQEGIATSLMEAQAAGLPAVGTKVGGIPDVLVHDKTGIMVERGDPAALARAIIFLLSNPQKAAEFAQAGRERVCSLFALPAIVDKLEALYEDL